MTRDDVGLGNFGWWGFAVLGASRTATRVEIQSSALPFRDLGRPVSGTLAPAAFFVTFRDNGFRV